MKGLLLAGGNGTRLGPLTIGLNKHLLPVYDKPMIYYSLSLLLLAGIREIGIVSSLIGLEQLKNLLGSGEDIGVRITYIAQDRPGGVPHALMCSKNFIDAQKVMVVLGDNFLYGDQLLSRLQSSADSFQSGCKIFLHNVNDPERFGVANVKNNQVHSFIEKPNVFISSLAVTGIYLFDENLRDICEKISPSQRGELEIVDVLNWYLKADQVSYETFGRGVIWWDLGTIEALHNATNFVAVTQQYDNRKIANIFEIAIKNGFVSKKYIENTLSSRGDRFQDFYDQN